MVRVTFWLQLLLLVFILRQSAADCDKCGELQNEPSILKRVTALEHGNEILKQLQAKQTVMKCHIERGKKVVGTIFGLTMTEQPNKETGEELWEKLKQLQANIDRLTKIEESNNQKIQEMRKKQEQLQATIDIQTKTMEDIIELQKLVCRNSENVCRRLLEAVKSGDVNIVKILVKWTNDNCTTHDNFHYTPLMLAAANGRVDLVRVLLEGGARVEITNVYQWTALHVAAFYGHLEVCRLLLDWGAKVDALDVTKETPLHHAALNGHLTVLKLLVEKGANVRPKNRKSLTASDMARSKGYSVVADWLDKQLL